MAPQPVVEAAVTELLQALGEDPAREGLRDTPKRVAKALIFALKGYEQTAQEVVGDAVFTERLQDEPCEMEDSGSWLGTSASAETSGLVLVRGIDVFSTSEADLRPLFGRCHVAYLPAGGRIVGLSKCARVAEVFARRLQTPERLANDIADGLAGVAEPHGVVVLLELWTIDQAASRVPPTVVCAARGVFLSEPAWLEEFTALLELRASSSLSHQLEALTLEVASAAGAPHCGCRPSAAGCGLACARLSPLAPRTPSPGASSAEDGGMDSAEDSAAASPAAAAAAGAAPWAGPGEPADLQLDMEPEAAGAAVQRVEQAALRMLSAAGRSPCSEGLQASARRFAEAMVGATAGSKQTLQGALSAAEPRPSGSAAGERGERAEAAGGDGACGEPGAGWVVDRDLEVVSMCEHHLLPFYGRAHVCYFPGQPRLSRAALQAIVSMHARRLQVQERLTRDIALDVQLASGAAGVMVVVEAGHMCMVSRGVEKPGSSTCSTAALGLFAGDPSLRTRFLAALRAGRADRGAAAAAASGGADAAKAKAKQLAPAVVGGDGAAHRHAA